MEILGYEDVKNPLRSATKKFRACPWHFYDGVPDNNPNEIIWGDVAITWIMSSGVLRSTINQVLNTAKRKKVKSLLNRIPPEYDLASAQEDTGIYNLIDELFRQLEVPHFSTSRISKLMARKRPYLIPILDKVVTRLLYDVAKIWKKNPNSAPDWFIEEWSVWEDQISPYLRMIREDLIRNYETLAEVRKELAKDKSTGVPETASILRIWESIIWWEFYEQYTKPRS